MKPFAVVSDRHFANWSAFSGVTPEGQNTRLAIQLAEMRRCADTLKAAGGTLIIDGGDTFHVRGSLEPSVLNPVMDLHRALITEGFTIISNPGNHDQEKKEVERLSNAVTALESVGVSVIQKPTLWDQDHFAAPMAFVPWIPDLGRVAAAILALRSAHTEQPYLFIHAPMNGVIAGIPDAGLDFAWLAGLGFKAVFCGHFHNHVEFPGNVYSIGALTQQTWSDVGSKAGFLIVSDEGVKWHKSHAPEFIDLNEATDPDDVPLLVPGNYVRCKVETSDLKEIETLRKYLEGLGAKGVIINAMRTAAVSARGASIAAGASLEVSVADFVRLQKFDHEALVLAECESILTAARGVTV